MKRKTLMLNSVLAVSAAGLVAFGITSLGAEGSAAATETETPVRTGSVTQTVSATGNTIAAEDLTLNFQGTGVLTEVDVTAGSTVTAGQVLARIDSTTADNQLKTAQANLASAQARMQGLLHPLTAQDLVKNQAAVDQAQAAVDTAQTALDNAKANLAQDTITQQNAIDRAKQALANAQAVSSTGMAGQQSALDQARQTLTDAASHLPVGVIVTTTDGTTAVADSTTLVQTYKSDQQLCAAVSNSSTYVLPDGLTCADIPARLSSATEVQTAARRAGDRREPARVESGADQADGRQRAGRCDRRDHRTGRDAAEGPAGNRHRGASARDGADELPVDARLQRGGRLARDRKRHRAAAGERGHGPGRGGNRAEGGVGHGAGGARPAGTVSAVNGAVGEAVASGGDGFITLVNLGTLQVKAGFSETDAAKVRSARPRP